MMEQPLGPLVNLKGCGTYRGHNKTKLSGKEDKIGKKLVPENIKKRNEKEEREREREREESGTLRMNCEAPMRKPLSTVKVKVSSLSRDESNIADPSFTYSSSRT